MWDTYGTCTLQANYDYYGHQLYLILYIIQQTVMV